MCDPFTLSSAVELCILNLEDEEHFQFNYLFVYLLQNVLVLATYSRNLDFRLLFHLPLFESKEEFVS